MSAADAYARIYAAVRKIPRGRVATYGQIATEAGLPGRARQVGYALHALQNGRVPWHRVVNAQGCISPRADEPGGSLLQRMRLEQEGVEFDARGRIPLDLFGWKGRRLKG